MVRFYSNNVRGSFLIVTVKKLLKLVTRNRILQKLQETRSAIADKATRRGLYIGQSKVTKHSTIPYVKYCAIVTLYLGRAPFLRYSTSKSRDIEIGVRGHSRSLKVVSFN